MNSAPSLVIVSGHSGAGRTTVMTALEDAFVLVKVDLTERQGPNSAVAAKHGVGSIPTMIVYEADGSRGESATGGQSKEGLLALANRYQRSTDDS